MFTDDFSRLPWVYFLQKKAQTFKNFEQFQTMVEKQSWNYIKILRTDRGREFVSNEFNTFCESQGIYQQLTSPCTPEQNGVTECKNCTVVEMTRSMLKGKESTKSTLG